MYTLLEDVEAETAADAELRTFLGQQGADADGRSRRPGAAFPRPRARRGRAVLLEPIVGPAAWTGAELAHRTDWIHHLTPAEVADIDAWSRARRARNAARAR